MNSSVADLIEDVIATEGGYSNDPADSGGETNYGITIRTARKHGYTGEMRDMPLSIAERIYEEAYWYEPGFYDVSTIAMPVARELFDTGINCGVGKAAEFFQMALNAFNREGTDYADIKEDGDIGPATIKAFSLYLKTRGNKGVIVMLKVLNSLQGAHYIELSRRRQKDERFTFGWFDNRVGMPT
jgi:lysozyme family protein